MPIPSLTSESGFRRLVETVPIGIALLQDARIRLVNAALLDLLHYRKFEELEGKGLEALLHGTDLERVKGLQRGEQDASGTLLLATQVYARDQVGGWRRLELQVVPLTFDGEECSALILRDLRSDERRRLLISIFEARDKERRRLAQDLHDESGQGLTSLIAGLAAIEAKTDGDLRELVRNQRDIAETTLDDLRALTHELYPAALDRFGLRAALERLGAHDVETDIDTLKDVELSPARQLALYRISQEALTNAWKHAEPDRVKLSVERKQYALVFRIEDDGRGFEVKGVADGLGLINMRERAESVGAKLRVTSQPGQGTVVEVEVALS